MSSRLLNAIILVFLLNAPLLADDAYATLPEDNAGIQQVSAADAVDWAAGKIRVTGVGAPPQDVSNATVRREMTERAALADAERKLVQAVAEIKIGPDRNVGSRMREKDFSRRIQGYIKGYTVVGQRELDDGRIEIDLELPLSGQKGLSRYLVE